MKPGYHQKSKKTIPRTGKILREKSQLTKSTDPKVLIKRKKRKANKAFKLLALGTPRLRIKSGGELKPTQLTLRGKTYFWQIQL